ncbi:MAG: protein TolQ, partial [Methylococcales bacterium]|nr:protein TolQ [Methylococcales bacterium]
MTNDLSIIHLIANASFVVQLVMLILLGASVVSWAFIRDKHKQLKHAVIVTDEFEQAFWSGVELETLYKKMASSEFEPEGIEKIFLVGYKEFSRMNQIKDIKPGIQVDSAQKV